jgi:pyridoxal 5'-phosphate synthase pdxS subunit
MPLDMDLSKLRHGTELLKRGFAKMQKGGVIMDVINAEQALIAEKAGAVAVMALERVPADIRAAGGVARMADPKKIQEIIDAVTIPVMAKCRIGHVAEARVLESLGVDMIDESEVLTPADPFFHVDKRPFTVPFVCGCRDLGEAARRIWEGAAMIRTKGEAGTGNVVEAVRHVQQLNRMIANLKDYVEGEVTELSLEYAGKYSMLQQAIMPEFFGSATYPKRNKAILFEDKDLGQIAKEMGVLLLEIKKLQRLPVVNFAAGGIATPADAAQMMLMGCDGVFVGSGIFKSEDPDRRAGAIVEAVLHYDDPKVIAEVSKGLGTPMKGLDIPQIPKEERLQERGW